jgi:antitoxin (DNA-binding transcriptional repressor) of toxin-antitoxin stability system
MSAVELTINVTEFKAKCLDIVTRLANGEFSRVRLLKRGKPIADVILPTPPDAETFDWEAWSRDLQALTGWMPENHDWTQPMMTEAEAEQWQARVEQKLSGAPRDPDNIWS